MDNATTDNGTLLLETTTPVPTDIQLERAISFRPFGMTIGIWAVIVGSIGNLLTILTYVANKKLRTTFNLFLVNLAVIDFWTAVGMLPFNLAGYFQMSWPFSDNPFTSRLQAFQYFCCGYSSIVFLVAITVNRFIGVMFPARYAELYSQRRTIAVLVFCNLFAPVSLSPFLFGTHPDCVLRSAKKENPTGALTGFHEKQFLSTFICLPPNSAWDTYMQVTRVVFQFLPLIAMVFFYAIILTSVKKKRNAVSVRLGLKSNPSFLSATKGSGGSKGGSIKGKKTQLQRRQQEDNRMVLISVVICIAFTITFLPSVIVNLLPNRYTIDIRWHMAASNVTWFNSSINPVIYVLLNRRFRREYWRIIKFAFGSVKGQFVHDSSSAHSSALNGRKGSQPGFSNSESDALKNAVRPATEGSPSAQAHQRA